MTTEPQQRNSLDHIVIAADKLANGIDYVTAALGISPAPGGRHLRMGTHNALLSLGPSCYLEVIAVDPSLPDPDRPRWFRLDEQIIRERLKKGPFLHHWVVRTKNIEKLRRVAPERFGPVVPMNRGNLDWLITIPEDGSLPAGGILPSLIQWSDVEPAPLLPDQDLRLHSLRINTDAVDEVENILEQLNIVQPVTVVTAAENSLSATFETPDGTRTIG